jgi:hypothetical protein
MFLGQGKGEVFVRCFVRCLRVPFLGDACVLLAPSSERCVLLNLTRIRPWLRTREDAFQTAAAGKAVNITFSPKPSSNENRDIQCKDVYM